MLLDHPAVPQAVTFGVPHDKHGEEVAAAVVLRERSRRGAESRVDRFAYCRSASRCRKSIFFTEQIPKGCDRQAAAHRVYARPSPQNGHSSMKLAIFGAGAIGGYLAVKLAPGGSDVTADRARAPSGAPCGARGPGAAAKGETVTAHPRYRRPAAVRGADDL